MLLQWIVNGTYNVFDTMQNSDCKGRHSPSGTSSYLPAHYQTFRKYNFALLMEGHPYLYCKIGDLKCTTEDYGKLF